MQLDINQKDSIQGLFKTAVLFLIRWNQTRRESADLERVDIRSLA